MTILITDIGTSIVQGDRRNQEDRYRIVQPGECKQNIGLFAVYDGHGGSDVVEHIKSHLHELVEKNLEQYSKYEAAIALAMKGEDETLKKEKYSWGGSTVVMTLIDTAKGLLVGADLGDSHAIIMEDTGSGWQTTRLSKVQKPSNRRERKRIEAAGGSINHVTGQPRIGTYRGLPKVALKLCKKYLTNVEK